MTTTHPNRACCTITGQLRVAFGGGRTERRAGGRVSGDGDPSRRDVAAGVRPVAMSRARSVLPYLVRRLLRSPNTELCFSTSCDRGGVEPREYYRSFGRVALPWFEASRACRTISYPSRCFPPTCAPVEQIGGWKCGVMRGGDSKRNRDSLARSFNK